MRAVNLIPAEQRSGSRIGAGQSHGAAYAVLGVLGLLALFAWVYGSAHRQVSTHKAEVASLTARAQRAQAIAEQLAPYTNFISLREQRTHAVSQLVDSRFDWAHAFHELGRVLPRDASIGSLDGKVGSAVAATTSEAKSSSGATVTSATPPGSVPTFILSGCATSQAEVALTLERLRLIQGVSEVTLSSSTKSSSGSTSSSVSSGACPAKDPAYSVTIAFDPLPVVPVAGSAAVTSNATTGGSR
jgi:hypothetical protein